MAVTDDGVDVSMHGFGVVDAAAVEVLDVSMVDDPGDVAFPVRSADTFHDGSRHFAEPTAADIALGIVIVDGSLRLIETCQVEVVKVTACDRHGRVRGFLACVVLVRRVASKQPTMRSRTPVKECSQFSFHKCYKNNELHEFYEFLSYDMKSLAALRNEK